MVLVAIVAASTGQCIRRLEATQRTYAAAAWVGWLLMVAAWVALLGRKRYLAEQLAGRTILRLPVYGMNPYWRIISRYLFSGYLLAIGPVMLVAMTTRAAGCDSTPAALATAFYPDAVFMAWLTAVCITLWWWKSDIRLCEAGVLWDKRFIRWYAAHEKWDPDRDAVTIYGVDQNGVDLRCDAVVRDEQRAAVEELLKYTLRTTATSTGGSTGGAILISPNENPV
jgi:hypothetical protein